MRDICYRSCSISERTLTMKTDAYMPVLEQSQQRCIESLRTETSIFSLSRGPESAQREMNEV